MSNFWNRIRNPHCTRCGLHSDTNIVCSVTGKGSINSSILIVTGSPDVEEEMYGKPGVGSKGRELINQFAEADWEHPYSMVPAICCRPPNDRAPKLASEVRVCRNKYLTRSIERINPKLILCLGVLALKAVTDDNSFNIKNTRRKVLERNFRVRGTKSTTKRRDIPIVVTYDPGAVLRSPHLRQVVVEDLIWVQRILSGKVQNSNEPSHAPVYVLQGRDEDLGAAFGQTKQCSIDLETTTLSPWAEDARILCAAASDQPFHAASFDIETPHLRDKLAKVLRSRKITKIGHNILFDYTWLLKNGYKINGPVFDTMVAFHLLNENYPDKSLAHLANLFLPGMENYDEGMKNERQSFSEVDLGLLEYCAKDSDAARRLRDRFYFALRRGHLLPAFRLRMRVLKALCRTQVAGLRIDRDRLDYHSKLNRKDRRRLKKWFKKNVHPNFNPASPQQVQKFLYETLGLPATHFSKLTEKPSANEKALVSLRRRLEQANAKDSIDYKVVCKLLSWRTSSQMEKMFLGPIRERHLSWDGMVHPSFKLAGTVTGRLACANPNTQQIPASIRDIVVSRFQGGSIVKADFSQMELRVLAHCSQEKSMLEVFHSGGDIHTATACKIYGIPAHRVQPDERYLAKTVNFGIIYGMEAKRLAVETGLKYSEAKEFLRAYWDTLPAVKNWMKDVRSSCRRKGYVTSLFGVRRRLPIDDVSSYAGAKSLREAVNHIIQSSASDITLVAYCEIDWYIRTARWRSLIINLVHDDITADSPPDEVDELALLIDEVGTSPNLKPYGIKLTVPLELEINVGPNWKDGVVVNA